MYWYVMVLVHNCIRSGRLSSQSGLTSSLACSEVWYDTLLVCSLHLQSLWGGKERIGLERCRLWALKCFCVVYVIHSDLNVNDNMNMLASYLCYDLLLTNHSCILDGCGVRREIGGVEFIFYWRYLAYKALSSLLICPRENNTYFLTLN